MTEGGVAAAALRAHGFVDAHGDPLQRARAAALRDAGALATVDGLLPPVDTPVGAFVALTWLDALRVRRGPRVECAVATLAAVQDDEGAWILGAERDEAGVVATTAAVAGLLAKTSCVRPAVLAAAGAWLGARWSPDRVQGGDLRLIAGYAGFFANFDHELSDAGLQWCGRELERAFRTGAADALAVASTFVFCDAQALPGAQLTRDEIILSLLAQQAPDGSFANDIEATVDALTALHRLAPIR